MGPALDPHRDVRPPAVRAPRLVVLGRCGQKRATVRPVNQCRRQAAGAIAVSLATLSGGGLSPRALAARHRRTSQVAAADTGQSDRHRGAIIGRQRRDQIERHQAGDVGGVDAKLAGALDQFGHKVFSDRSRVRRIPEARALVRTVRRPLACRLPRIQGKPARYAWRLGVVWRGTGTRSARLSAHAARSIFSSKAAKMADSGSPGASENDVGSRGVWRCPNIFSNSSRASSDRFSNSHDRARRHWSQAGANRG